MKKVLHISSYYHPNIGGVETTAREIVNCLKDNYEQKVICFSETKKFKIETIDNIEVIKVGYITKQFSQAISLSYKKKLKKLVKEFKPDIIHIHYPNPLVVMCLNSIKTNAKIIVHWHLDIIKQKNIKKFFHKSNIKLLNKATKVIATTQLYADNSEYLPLYKDKVIAIPSAIDIDKLQLTEETIKLADSITKEKLLCFTFGRHVEYKGLIYLIDCVKKHKLENYEFVIAGKGPKTDELKDAAKGISNIKFLGFLSEEEKNAYLSKADVFAFPSITKNEAFGLSLVESMYFSLPSVSFTIEGSGVNYVTVNNETCLEAPNRDIDELANNLIRLEDKVLRDKLGSNAKKRVEDLFTKEKVNKQIRELYKAVE